MRFHCLAGLLLSLSGLLLYGLIFGFQKDLDEARVTIQKESVQSTSNLRKIRKAPELHTYINKAIIDRSQKSLPSPIGPAIDNHEVIDPSQVVTNDNEVYDEDDKDYWCRSVPLLFETNPIRCLYPNACFGCNGPIIVPEIETAIPMCANGMKSQLYHVECCPSYYNGSVDCPRAEDCFHAKAVPPDHCSCNDRSDCKMVQLGEKIECVCVQQ